MAIAFLNRVHSVFSSCLLKPEYSPKTEQCRMHECVRVSVDGTLPTTAFSVASLKQANL